MMAADSFVNYNILYNDNTTQPKYTLVSIDIDTTGRRLLHEIVQLAAYTRNDHFEQYIMPYINLNPAARERHQLYITSIGIFRMLKSMQTKKIIKSKSEIASLNDFLDWLEKVKVKDTGSNGIILLYHEQRKFVPYMILESMKKYNLLGRFRYIVKYLVNGYNVAETISSEKSHSLKYLAKSFKLISNNMDLLNGNNNNVTNTRRTMSNNNNNRQPLQKKRNQFVNKRSNKNNNSKQNINTDNIEYGNAAVRAKMAYEIALVICQKFHMDLHSVDNYNTALNVLAIFMYSMENDLTELKYEKVNLKRENSFRPVFISYFKSSIYHRMRAVKFRNILAKYGYDLGKVQSIWGEKKYEGIRDVFDDIDDIKHTDKYELTQLFDSFCDPTKTTIKPIIKRNPRYNGRKDLRQNNTINARSYRNTATENSTLFIEHGAGGDIQTHSKTPTIHGVADSTTKTPNYRGGYGGNRGRSNNNKRYRRSPNKKSTNFNKAPYNSETDDGKNKKATTYNHSNRY